MKCKVAQQTKLYFSRTEESNTWRSIVKEIRTSSRGKTVGTLSSGNADGDGDAETCEKTRERTPLWWEFTTIKQHRRDRGFGTAKLIEIIDFRPLFYIRMTSFIEVRNQLLISNDEGVWNDDELLLLYDLSRSNNLDLRHDFFPDFNFDDLEDDEYLSEFRLHQCDLPFLTELYDEVNELISKCLIRLARQICVPTGKHLSKPLILRLIMKTRAANNGQQVAGHDDRPNIF